MMNEHKPSGEIWNISNNPQGETTQSVDETFVQEVVAQVQKKVLLTDFLGLIFMGFWGVIMGFLKMKKRPEGVL